MKNSSNQMRSDRNNSLSGVKDYVKDYAADAAAEIDSAYPEIDDIRKDWKALRSDVAKLTSHATSDGRKKLKDATSGITESLEKHVTQKPVQTLAAAFAVGIVASFLFGRR